MDGLGVEWLVVGRCIVVPNGWHDDSIEWCLVLQCVLPTAICVANTLWSSIRCRGCAAGVLQICVARLMYVGHGSAVVSLAVSW